MGQNRGALVSPKKKKARTQGFSEKAGGGNMEDRFNFAWHRKIEHFLKHDFPKNFDSTRQSVLSCFGFGRPQHTAEHKGFSNSANPPLLKEKKGRG